MENILLKLEFVVNLMYFIVFVNMCCLDKIFFFKIIKFFFNKIIFVDFFVILIVVLIEIFILVVCIVLVLFILLFKKLIV